MTDFIDTYLLNHGMEKHELCAIKRRELIYGAMSIFAALTVLFVSLIALGVQPPLG